MALGDVAAVATVVALLIVAYVHAKPAINRWASVKFLRIQCEIDWDDLLAREQARQLPWRKRLRRWRRTRMFRLVQRLMTRTRRIAKRDLFLQLMAELKRSEHLPVPPDRDPLVVEAAALAKHERDRRQDRQRARVHRKVVCASGCGTRYGKRRPDHNFVGGSGIEGGWLCPSDVSCRDGPTGDHYCGMCACQDWLSTIGVLPDQASDRTAPPADAESTTTSSPRPAEAADDQPSVAPRPCSSTAT